MRPFLLSVSCFLAASGFISAQENTVVPVIAWGAPGLAGNRWFTELYLANPTSQPQDVIVAGVQVLRVKESLHPCLPPVTPIRVPPLQTRVVLTSDLNRWLGCPEEFVGGLQFSHPASLLVVSRMTNVKGFQLEPSSRPLQGYSQEIPGVPMAELVGGTGQTYMVPALLWHPLACGPNQYDTYLYFNNPTATDVTVRLLPRAGESMNLKLGNVEVELPYQFKVPAGRVVQWSVQPAGGSGAGECGEPQVFDLFFEADGKLAVLASVVDRASNDARTVVVRPENQLKNP